MFRHLKNLNELCLYGGFSCGLAFLARLEPAFYFPILFLRIAIVAYCLYVIGFLEKNREFGIVLSASLLLGWLGGYWDYLELVWAFKQSEVIGVVSLLIAIAIFVFLLALHLTYGRK